jgi:hypothetical protein
MSLEDQRHIDCDCHQKRNNCARDAGGECGSGNLTDIAAEVGVELSPGAAAIEGEKKSTKSAENERKKVENEDRLAALRLSGEDGCDEEHDHACAELCSEIDAGLDWQEVPKVDVRYTDGDCGDAICHEERDALGVRVEAACRRHLEGLRFQLNEEVLEMIGGLKKLLKSMKEMGKDQQEGS